MIFSVGKISGERLQDHWSSGFFLGGSCPGGGGGGGGSG